MRRFLDAKFIQRTETIGGKTYFFKSSWEIAYAKFLEWLKNDKQIRDWLYEPDIFKFEKIKKGTMYYCPDFRLLLLNSKYEYHEVKGYMDQKSKVKIKRFVKYYPHVSIKLVDKNWFDKNREGCKAIIADWDV